MTRAIARDPVKFVSKLYNFLDITYFKRGLLISLDE